MYDGAKLMKFDYNGNVLYEKLVDVISTAKIEKCKDGSYLLNNWSVFGITKVDHNFMNAQYAQTYFTWAGNPYLDKMVYISDSDSYVLGFATDSSTGGPFIGHINNNQVCDWYTIFTDSIYLYYYSFVNCQRLNDKSWIFLGYSAFAEGAESPGDYLLLRTDSTFNPLKTTHLKSVKQITGDFFFEYGINSEIGISSNNVFFVEDCYDSTVGVNGGINFEVIKTDTSFSNMCNSEELQLGTNTYAIDSTSLFGLDFVERNTWTTYSITSIVNDVTLSFIDSAIISSVCSDTLTFYHSNN